MSKKAKPTTNQITGYTFIKKAAGVEEYELKTNGLRVLYFSRPKTGVVTTNITYKVGARDEARGETGVAHMLEHMLFKPTKADVKKGIADGRAMKFERETGSVLNANTWKDRTTYYFSYPTKYYDEALAIEAERMTGVFLSDEVLKPEQGNVLSEFDMYNGDPSFALSTAMCTAAFQSHPYGHETIGFREDIEDYTADKLDRFYKNYYRPDNATMMVVGDIERNEALDKVRKYFKDIKNPATPIPRFSIREPKQEGLRRTRVCRESTTNILSLGFKYGSFPQKKWFTAVLMSEVLTSGPDSILDKLLIDTGKASAVSFFPEPLSETTLATINIYLAKDEEHSEIESLTLKAIKALRTKHISSLVSKTKEAILTSEIISRDSSQAIAAELTEYVSAGDWSVYADTIKIIDSITAKDVIDMIQESFVDENMTIGEFIGN